MITTIILDSCLYALTTIVISITSRELRLYNLAAGAWLVLGGWMGAITMGTLKGTSVPVLNSIVLCCFFLIILQAGIPYLLGQKIRINPLTYLFVSLGMALIITNVVPAFFLKSSSVTIPFERSTFGIFLFAILSFVISCLVFWLFRSPFWAYLVLKFRINLFSPKLRLRISFLIFGEILGLLLLGATGFYIHKGQFGTAEYHTIIPILSVFATKGNPWRAAIWSLIVVIAGHLIVAFLPPILGIRVNDYYRVLPIIFLLVFVIIKSRPVRPLISARAIESIAPRVVKLIKDPESYRIIKGGGLLISLTIITLVLVIIFPQYFTNEDIHRALLVSVFATISWIILKYLGVMTISLPIIGAISVYAIYHLENHITIQIIFLILLIMFSAHFLWWLRVLKNEPALVVDLSLVICIHQLIKSTPQISDPEEILFFKLPFLESLDSIIISVVQLMIILIMFFLTILVACKPRLRAFVLGLGNFKAGVLHGISVKLAFYLTAFILFAVTIFSSVIYHLISGTILISETTLEAGLTVLLFGYLMHRSPYIAFLVIFLYYSLLRWVISGTGVSSGVFLGILFLGVSFCLRQETQETTV